MIGTLSEASDPSQYNAQAWVGLSPMLGVEAWYEMVVVYAQHLVTKGNHRMAALYYLAAGEIHKAIQVYSKAAMFREAILLAKVRLGSAYVVLQTSPAAQAGEGTISRVHMMTERE
jgi:hypothetical protein